MKKKAAAAPKDPQPQTGRQDWTAEQTEWMAQRVERCSQFGAPGLDRRWQELCKEMTAEFGGICNVGSLYNKSRELDKAARSRGGRSKDSRQQRGRGKGSKRARQDDAPSASASSSSSAAGTTAAAAAAPAKRQTRAPRAAAAVSPCKATKPKAKPKASPKKAPAKAAQEPELFIVEKILDVRKSKRFAGLELLVKWQGYAAAHNSWEPPKNLKGTDAYENYVADKKKKGK